MIKIYKDDERGHVNHGWLDSHFIFSFADYHDPQRMGFRSLRVINDDRIMPGGGFDMHPHRDMEIISYLVSGQLEHKDSMGNGRVIKAGEVQYMSAGSGVLHSEFNPSKDEVAHLAQIWIVPDERGAKPRYADRSFRDAPSGKLNLAASKSGRDGSIAIRQDADLWFAKLDSGQEVASEFRKGRHQWVQVLEGEVALNGQKVSVGEGAAVTGETDLRLAAAKRSQVLLFDLA